MATKTLFFLSLCLPSLVLALEYYESPERRLWRRGSSVPASGYYNPYSAGGSLLTMVNGTYPAGLGEPINVILAGNSDSAVLVDQEANGGLRNYYLSIGFSGECLGQHSGSDQAANLGDGHGYLNETAVMRWNYGDPTVGTCEETIEGGNHFRYWRQNGPSANSNAIFMALSYEMPIADQHNIIVNGYDYGRDWFIGNITHSPVPTLNLTNSTAYTGYTSYGGYNYTTQISYVSGLLQNTSNGINHYQSVPLPGMNAIDGLVAVLQVAISPEPPKTSSAWKPSSSSWPCFVLLGFLPFLHLA